jgi:hypothetical protein
MTQHLPLHYTQSMEWDEALETIAQAAPELTPELDLLDSMSGPDQSIAALPESLWPIAQLVFLLQTDPLTPSLH